MAQAQPKEFPISKEVLKELLLAVIEKNASLRFQARGGSMSPFIKDEDTLTISPMAKDGPKLGQVVAYSKLDSDNLVVHRIVGKINGGYLIKGDNTSCLDGLVRRQDILGYVSAVERKGKRVRLGLGLERILIVFLSRTNILRILLAVWRRLLPFSLRRFILSRAFNF